MNQSSSERSPSGGAMPIRLRVTADELVALAHLLEVAALPGLSDLPVPEQLNAISGRRGLVARGLISDTATATPMPLGALLVTALTEATSRCTVIDSRPGFEQFSQWSLGRDVCVVGRPADIGVYDVLIGEAADARAALGGYLAMLSHADELQASDLATGASADVHAARITARSATGDANEFWISDVLLVCFADRVAEAHPDDLVSARPALEELRVLLGLPLFASGSGS